MGGMDAQHHIISIHAPREGCDVLDWEPGGHWTFQSTHPVRGATNYLGVREILQPISIHAPREGCDSTNSSPTGPS